MIERSVVGYAKPTNPTVTAGASARSNHFWRRKKAIRTNKEWRIGDRTTPAPPLLSSRRVAAEHFGADGDGRSVRAGSFKLASRFESSPVSSKATPRGDTAIANYTPMTDRDKRAVTPGQIGFFSRNKIDMTNIKCFGLADKIIGRFMARLNANLVMPEQLKFLKQLGIPEDEASKLSKDEASRVIGERIGR